MRREIKWSALPGAILLAIAFAAIVMACAQFMGAVDLAAWGIGGFVVSMAIAFLPGNASKVGLTMVGIQREVWENHIEETLWANNEFLMGMADESEYVDNKTVHSPQSGTPPGVQKNRVITGSNVGPVGTNTRVDTIIDWSIDEYTSDPFKITDAETRELSYGKRESVLKDHRNALANRMALECIVLIAPTGTATLADGVTVNANILRSTGITNNDPADVRSSPAYTPSATGDRLNFTLYDIKKAKKLFDKQDIPAEDRHMLISPDAGEQLINDMIATQYRGVVGDVFDLTTGMIKKVMGFEIHVRSQVCQFNNAATPVVKAVGAAGAAADNDAMIFWQKEFLARATGDIHVYETTNSAVYYGDVYSMLVRFGAHKRRVSELGVGAIVQTAA